MTEADVMYSNVTFTRTKENGKEPPSAVDETMYSEVAITKSLAPAQQPDLASNKGLKVTERVSLILLCVLLVAAVAGLGVDNFRTKKNLQNMLNENKALRMNLSGITAQPVTVKPTTVGSCHKCDVGWEQHGGTCYYFSTSLVSWSESINDCGHRGGDLVKIDSREEQSFLDKRVTEKMMIENIRFWIGLTDSKTEGKWLWADDSPLNTSLSFWHVNEPDNWTGEDPDGEDCARMGEREGAEDLKSWFDRTCKSPEKFICEKPAETGRNEVTCV